MGNANIKTELRTLIDQEDDLKVLQAIKTLLEKTGVDSRFKEKLTTRAQNAENDIAEHRVMDRSELESKLKAQ